MTADTVGGVWTYSLDLAKALGAEGVKVTCVASGGRPSPAQEAAAAAIPNLTLVGLDGRLEWQRDCEDDLAALDSLLLGIEEDERPDVVHVNGFAQAAAGFSAPVVLVAHSCVGTWWRACHGGPAPAEWNRYRGRIAAGLAAADAVVTPSAAFLATFCAEHGRPARARAIHNGRDGSLFCPRRKKPFALAAGRLWDEAKNTSVLAEVARRVDHPILVAGEGAPIADALNFVSLGPLEPGALARRMGEAAVFVAPARYEPFGLAVLEAALSGAALVLSDIATFRELWDGAAEFVDPQDAGAIAAAVDRLLADGAAASAAGAAARRRARRYGLEPMGRAYLDLYGGLVAERRGRWPAHALPMEAMR